jgi:PST family polysaccharide transporter
MSDPGTRIGERALAGVGWNSLSMVIRQTSQFVTTAVLARLLLPSDFGLVGMAAIVTGLVYSVRELGLSAAIVQKKELDQMHLSSSFWANIMGGLVLFGICALAAPIASRFFRDPIVAPILIVSSTSLVISSFGAVHRASLLRNLRFKAIAVAEVGISLAYGFVAIAMAALGFGVWSLVGGTLFGSGVGVILWWSVLRWRPALEFSWRKFLELFRFGANVMGSGLVGYFSHNIDYLVIGRRLGAFPLGIYTLAFKLISFPLTRVSYMVTDVAFPAFSRIQGEDARLRRGYTRTVSYLSLIIFPLLFGLMVLAPEFVRVVYGPKWTPAILPLRVMCVLGMLKGVGTTVGSILKAKGRPDVELKYSILFLSGMVAAVLLGSRYGIAGVALAITVLALLAFPVIQLVTNRMIGLSSREYLGSLLPAFVSSALMSVVIASWRMLARALILENNLFILLSSFIAGVAAYYLFLRLLRVKELQELPELFLLLPGMGRLAGRRTCHNDSFRSCGGDP